MINNLNMIEQKNTSQLNKDPESENKLTKMAIQTTTQPSHNYNIRPRPTERNKQCIITQSGQQSTDKTLTRLHVHIMMTHMSWRAHKKIWWQWQWGTTKGTQPASRSESTTTIRLSGYDYRTKKYLQYLLYLKEKCDSIIKAWECADGRLQREYITKSETTLPSVTLE